MNRSSMPPIALALCAVVSPVASAFQPPRVVFSKITGHPTAVIAGAKDLAGAPVFAEFRAMENLYGSSEGTRWMLKGRTQLGSDLETMLMMGSGTSGSVLIQEGQPAVGGGFYDFIGSDVGRFDDADNAAFSARVRTNQTGTGAPANAQRVLRYAHPSGVLTLAFAQTDAYTGLSDTGVSGDETVGNSVGSIHLLNDGTIGCQDSTIINIHTSRRPAIFYELAMFHQTNVTSVFAIGGLGPRTWATISANGFFTTPGGDHWMAQGDINGPSGALEVLVRDGTVVLQENESVGASGLLLGSVFQNTQSSSGHWIARGRDNSGTAASAPDWAVLDGVVVAKTGDPITPGSLENWGAEFSAVTVDNGGNWAMMGTTSSLNTTSDAVIVYNGETVLLREGDRVDLDGNGVLDDDAYVGRGTATLTPFSANNMFLSADGHLYALVNLRNEAGQDLNSTPAFGTPVALVRVALPSPPAPCDPDVNCDFALDGFDVETQEKAVGGDVTDFCQADPDYNGDFALDGFDVEAVEIGVGGGPCP